MSAVPGRPSRAAVVAALTAYVAVQKGEGLRMALQKALRDAPKLGGQERRFAAFAAREVLRHQALVDWAAKRLGTAPGSFVMAEDRSLVRYTLWRRLVTRAAWTKIRDEVKLPGPLRPRTISDALLEKLATDSAGELEAESERLDTSLRHSFPRWLSDRMGEVVPEAELPFLMAALNQEPALILRVRPSGTGAQVTAQLAEEGVGAAALGLGSDGLEIREGGHKVFDTQPFRRGQLQVQDFGSQLIVQLCRPQAGFLGGRVADICAGAGGKTLYLADEVGPSGHVLAADTSARRLEDARERVREWRLKQVSFQRAPNLAQCDSVLIDAPCSGTGSLAREPDQKWKLSPKAVDAFAATQAQLLATTARHVRVGGVVVYATCSLLRQENEAQVEQFLERHPAFVLEPASTVLPEAHEACQGGYLRAFPHRVPGGGFFAARLRRMEV